MKNHICIILIFICVLSESKVIARDYGDYHTNINHAEKLIFVDKEFKNGVQTYLKTFKDFDFVFLQDCITAMQITLYIKDRVNYLKLLEKAYQNGLLPRHLEAIPYFRNNEIFIQTKELNIAAFKKNRGHYIGRIDTSALFQMYQIYAYDQAVKNPRNGQSSVQYQREYNSQINDAFNKLKRIIELQGIPSDKILGIQQNDIMQELQVSNLDMPAYYNKYKRDYRVKLNFFSFEEINFCSYMFYAILHHYSHEMKNYKLFDDEFYLRQIRLGNLHPKDYAALNDFRYNGIDKVNKPIRDDEQYFSVGIKIGPGFDNVARRKSDIDVNKSRARFFIAQIENDRAKWQFMQQNGMYISWGYMGNRS